jgi:hypothetical protein
MRGRETEKVKIKEIENERTRTMKKEFKRVGRKMGKENDQD